MKTPSVVLLILVLLYINPSTEWPTHTVCKEDNLEIYYKSCGLSQHEMPQHTSTGYSLSQFKRTMLDVQAGWKTIMRDKTMPEASFEAQDPQQDFAFSIDHCSDITTHTFNIRAAAVLRHSIKELYVKLDMIINGKTVLTYSETLCGPGHVKLVFCGMKKGEHFYYEGPVTLGIKEIPQGDYTLSAKLTNEDHVTVACAEFTVKNYLDYY